ncbi:MAG: endonuclease/exonuclease/phosphatase family protein [Planctomycetes bacterium]|nr:endonuclease/exonuclease/phosphatase family protein [Planctomycetota bacterium]
MSAALPLATRFAARFIARFIARFAALVAALVAALPWCGCIGPRSAAPAPTELRAMSCNVRYGTADDGPDAWPLRCEALAAAIAAAAPDVLGVQEALDFQVAFLEQKLPHHRRVGQGRDGGTRGEHAALFLDERLLEVVDAGDFWLSETPDVVGSVGWDAALTRLCTWAHVRVRATGCEFHVWNTHFDHRGERARLGSARLLAQRIAATPGPHLLIGDLNCGETSAPLDALRAAGLRDSFRELHPDATAVGTFHAFRGTTDGAKIDYVLVDRGFATLAAELLTAPATNGRWPSDHHFVTATLRMR